jgi:hypothetical protein
MPPQRQLARPIVALAYFGIGAAPRFPGLAVLVEAIKRADVPDGADIFAGTYGPNLPTADAIEALPSGVYAPLFSIQPGTKEKPGTSFRYYQGRNLPKEDEARLDPHYDGQIVTRTPGEPLPSGDHLNWGLELGRRFRDALRLSGRVGAPIATAWQFDEVVDQVVGGSLADRYRLFVAGIVRALHGGRQELSDEPVQGIVWAAGQTLAPLPGLPAPSRSPLAQLWAAIDQATIAYAGEEYVRFDGRARDAAVRSAEGQRRLLAAGPKTARRRIGAKYIVGMTPGFIKDLGKGGNVNNWPIPKVNRWRDEFAAARQAAVPALGFGQYDFTGPNSPLEEATGAIHSAAIGVRPLLAGAPE